MVVAYNLSSHITPPLQDRIMHYDINNLRQKKNDEKDTLPVFCSLFVIMSRCLSWY